MGAKVPGSADMQRRLADVVMRHRIVGNKTQEDIAETAGISVQILRRIEAGKGNPSLLTLVAIARALNVQLDVIVREVVG
jgi:DNA-binding XRE family transcriptional regulator